MREFAKRMKLVAAAYIQALDRVPAEQVVVNAYAYDLLPGVIDALLAEMAAYIDDLFTQSQRTNWFLNTYVEVAYQRGTAQAFANMAKQSKVYEAGRNSLVDLLRGQAYIRRVAMVRSRAFEEMKGLSGGIKADMARVLADGVGRGLGPRDIATNLRDQAGIETRRANRIARTEVSMALRRAKWDEEAEAKADFGLKTKLMHFSALSPTTRRSHAVRHGRLFTDEQVREWYSQDGNGINCKCSQTAVLVDDDGKPLNPAVVERARATYQKLKARGNSTWTQTKRPKRRK